MKKTQLCLLGTHNPEKLIQMVKAFKVKYFSQQRGQGVHGSLCKNSLSEAQYDIIAVPSSVYLGSKIVKC